MGKVLGSSAEFTVKIKEKGKQEQAQEAVIALVPNSVYSDAMVVIINEDNKNKFVSEMYQINFVQHTHEQNNKFTYDPNTHIIELSMRKPRNKNNDVLSPVVLEITVEPQQLENFISACNRIISGEEDRMPMPIIENKSLNFSSLKR
jgi:hypothetical protein